MDSIRVFRGVATAITLAFLSALYLFYIEAVDFSLATPVIIALLSFSILFYVTVHHDFEDPALKLVLSATVSLILLVSLLIVLIGTVFDVFAPSYEFTVQQPGVLLPPEQFLPEWWLLALLIPAGVLLISGAVLDADRVSYSTPSGLEELAESPIYFALVCAVLGLWGVLFVGLNIVQRIVVIAPIFEELLKFGVALAIGAAIFGRSMYARVGIALVIGCIFGLVEHSITYAGEPDIIYLYRVLFHSVSTMIAVAVYTSFEKQELPSMLWIAPIYSIILHYLNNAFAVASGVLLSGTPEETQMVVSILFGAVLILLGLVLLGLAVTRQDITAFLHREPYTFLREMI